MVKRQVLRGWTLVVILLWGWLRAGTAHLLALQAPPIEQRLSQMTSEEKVGQLFLVAFVGRDTGPESDIAQLIRDYKIGGVVLLASNSNFYNLSTEPALSPSIDSGQALSKDLSQDSKQGHAEDTPHQVVTLTNALQELALSDAGPP